MHKSWKRNTPSQFGDVQYDLYIAIIWEGLDSL